MGNHRDGLGSQVVLLLGEPASPGHGQTQSPQETRGGVVGEDGGDGAVAVQRGKAPGAGRDGGEDLAVIRDVQIRGIRGRAGVTTVGVLQDFDQPVRSLERGILQQERVHEAEGR